MSSKGSKLTPKLFKNYKNLFYKRTGKIRIGDQNFISFDMIWEKWSLKHINKKFFKRVTKQDKVRLEKLNLFFKKIKNPILITHSPPYGILDKINDKNNVNHGLHFGSKLTRKICFKFKPILCPQGTMHENPGKK